jgi:hypothetical protein
LNGSAQEPTLADDMILSQDIIQCLWTHPVCQGGFVLHTLLHGVVK